MWDHVRRFRILDGKKCNVLTRPTAFSPKLILEVAKSAFAATAGDSNGRIFSF